ncbi:hypothetical protein CEXT_463411 [Caerostris extrusa]|uniref:Uncharacterized protein n=1 Tax=Caerostris extrusa TaxID=172846 RepID=A0AAV4V4M4_CAEEX|nr:hypothetical protein CEXT_463411 [Caerostris extrusa]
MPKTTALMVILVSFEMMWNSFLANRAHILACVFYLFVRYCTHSIDVVPKYKDMKIPLHYNPAMKSPDAKKWQSAMQEEIMSSKNVCEFGRK